MDETAHRLLDYADTLRGRVAALRARHFEEGDADRAASEAAADELERVVAELAGLVVVR